MNEEFGKKERIEGIGDVLKEKVRESIHVNATIAYCTTAPPWLIICGLEFSLPSARRLAIQIH